MRRAILAAVLVAVGGLLVSSCYDTPDQKLHFGAGFVLIGDKNEPVTALSFLVGQKVQWCNETASTVIVTTSDRKILGGRTSVRLAPGECIEIKVLKSHGDFTLQWAYVGEDGTVEGEGGSPGKVECPPPPQPC